MPGIEFLFNRGKKTFNFSLHKTSFMCIFIYTDNWIDLTREEFDEREKERFFNAIDRGLEGKVFDEKRANGYRQDFLKAIYDIDNVSDYTQIRKIRNMTPEDRRIFLKTYSPRTVERILEKLTQKPIVIKKR